MAEPTRFATRPEAVRATFARRRTALPETPPFALTDEFAADTGKQTQWRAFTSRGRLSADASLGEVVGALRHFLLPVLDAARRDEPFDAAWTPGGPWS